MTLKKCSCGKLATTKNCKKLGVTKSENLKIFWFNHECGTTLILKTKITKAA